MRRLLLLTSALLSPLCATAQDSLCAEPVPRFGDGLVFFDRVSSIFGRLDAAVDSNLTSGSARLEGDMLERFRTTEANIRTTLDLIAERNTAPASLQQLYAGLGAYQAFLREAYRPAVAPAEVERLLCPLRTSYLRWVKDRLVDHERKLVIRHGPRSERLNVLEMLLNEWMSQKMAMGQLRDPPRLEWILRAQVLGFQYEEVGGHVRPGSPTYQLGASYYMFGTSRASQWLNHIGVAAAYQRHLTMREDFYGGVLHIQQYDIGFLCPRLSCKSWVIVGSKNVSLLPGTWAKLRQQVAGG